MKKVVTGALSILALSMFAGCANVDAASSDAANSVEGGAVNVPVVATPVEPAVEPAVGIYALDQDALEEALRSGLPDVQGPAAEQINKMLEQMLKGFDGTIELKADHTCVMKMTLMGSKQDTGGTWALLGDQLTITSQEQGQERKAQVVTLVDGVITMTQESGGQSMSLHFAKAAK